MALNFYGNQVVTDKFSSETEARRLIGTGRRIERSCGRDNYIKIKSAPAISDTSKDIFLFFFQWIDHEMRAEIRRTVYKLLTPNKVYDLMEVWKIRKIKFRDVSSEVFGWRDYWLDVRAFFVS